MLSWIGETPYVIFHPLGRLNYRFILFSPHNTESFTKNRRSSVVSYDMTSAFIILEIIVAMGGAIGLRSAEQEIYRRFSVGLKAS